MAFLKRLWAKIDHNANRREQRRYEAYLSTAGDLYELEYLQRAWERRSTEHNLLCSHR